MNVIDTHCHIDLIVERGLKAHSVLQEAQRKGVSALVQISTNLQSAQYARQLAQKTPTTTAFANSLIKSIPLEQLKFPDIYWTAGLHPCNAGENDAREIEREQEIFSLIRKNYQDTRFVGIGETGLDYFHTQDKASVSRQQQSFMQHLDLARELHLPIILHIRDDRIYNPEKTSALQDCLALIREFSVQGVLHCFSYSYREAKAFVDLGWFVSYSGLLTFKNAKAAQEGAIRLPLDCLLVETDAPFLAPTPYRGQVNQPAYVTHTLEFLANLRSQKCNEDKQHVKQNIFANSQRFLKLKNIV